MDIPANLTFDAWPDPVVTVYVDPEGAYSRLGWLPLIGPTAWLIWGTVAAQLRHQPIVTWAPGDLAAAHGISRAATAYSVMGRTIARLALFHLVVPVDGRHLVRTSAPPLGRRQLDRLPAHVAALHRQTFEAGGRRAG